MVSLSRAASMLVLIMVMAVGNVIVAGMLGFVVASGVVVSVSVLASVD